MGGISTWRNHQVGVEGREEPAGVLGILCFHLGSNSIFIQELFIDLYNYNMQPLGLGKRAKPVKYLLHVQSQHPYSKQGLVAPIPEFRRQRKADTWGLLAS